uniref:Reverse transcriptase domain-containing protein n=1 Tax=Strongyloides venezuelensis TaxID=75913 RepID=A0A0K0EWR9_STRVS
MIKTTNMSVRVEIIKSLSEEYQIREAENNEILGLFDHSAQPPPAEESTNELLINALLHNKKLMTLSEQGMKAVFKIFSSKRISNDTIDNITERIGVYQDLQFFAPGFSIPYYSKLKMSQWTAILPKYKTTFSNQSYVVDGLSDIRREVVFKNFSPKFNKGLPSIPLDMEEKVTRMDSSDRISILPKHAEALFKNVANTPQGLLAFIQKESRKRAYNNTANNKPESLPFWQKNTPTDSVFLDYKRNGVDLCIVGEPTQNKIGRNKFSSNKEEQFIDSEIKDLLRSNSIKEHDNPKWISPLIVVNSSKMRLVLDLSSLNECIRHYGFKCESMKDVTDLLEPNAYLTSIDLSAAYHSCAVRAHQTEYLGFRITNTLTAMIRANGIKMTRFYDDFLIPDTDKDLLIRDTNYCVNLLHAAGFSINEKKTDFLNMIEFSSYANFLTRIKARPLQRAVNKCIGLPPNYNRIVNIYCDNTTTLALLHNKGSVDKIFLSSETEKLLDFFYHHRLYINLYHIPGAYNQVADRLPWAMPITLQSSSEATLIIEAREEIKEFLLNKFNVIISFDLFAFYENKFCDKFVTLFADDRAFRRNAYSFNWQEIAGEEVIAFPP